MQPCKELFSPILLIFQLLLFHLFDRCAEIDYERLQAFDVPWHLFKRRRIGYHAAFLNMHIDIARLVRKVIELAWKKRRSPPLDFIA